MSSKKLDPKTYQQAYVLRHNPTEAESRLWSRLCAHQVMDVHFRRQYAIGKYIVDLCATRKKLIIELDGSQHMDREEQDQERSCFLTIKGNYSPIPPFSPLPKKNLGRGDRG
jgi:very-short-patch-repair endonuclease